MTTLERLEARSRERVDEASGVRERAAFLRSGGSEIFAYLHAPPEPVGGLVICCPIESEMENNYRREVLLARALAGRGVAVARFHYRGSGHSHGDPAETTFETMREDALAATAWLREAARPTGVAFLGTRLGGLIAAAAAARHPGAPLALWEPAVDARRYFREVFRTPSVLALKDGDVGQVSAEEQLRTLVTTGVLDVVGYPIHRGLFETCAGRSLADEPGPGPRRVLLLQFGHGRELRGGLRRVAERWREMGYSVDARVLDGPTVWWLEPGEWLPEESRAASLEIVGTTADWIVESLRG